MKLINLLTRIISEQPESDENFFKGLVTSEKYDGNIFELMTDKHGIKRAEKIQELESKDEITK